MKDRQATLARRLRGQALQVVGVYVVVAGAWIALSDRLLEALISDRARLVQVSMFKGVAFVLATAALLFTLLRRIFGETARAVEALAVADDALRESRARLDQIARAIDDVVWLAAEDGQVLYANAAAVRGLGRDPTTEAPTAWLERVHPDDRARVEASLAAHPRGGWEDAFRVRRADGELRWVRGRTYLVPAADGAPARIAGVLQDITEYRALQDQVHQAQKLEAIGRLAGTIAHDFNNLLHVITSSADLGLAAAPADAAQREDLVEIQRAAERASQLTRQLLAFSRQQLSHPTTLDLGDAVRGMERMLARLLGPTIDLRIEVAAAPALVDIDALQLEQVVMNLAVNARDAMPEGGALTIRIDEAPRAPREGAPATRHLRLAVTDTGSGIEEAVRAHMFEPFFTTKAPGRGTGLGLATVEGIVSQNRGHIAVVSSPGHGARFEIYLPPSAATAATPPAKAPAAGALRGTETLLLVDDDAQIRETIARVLTRHGYHVLVAGDPEEALAACARAGDALALVITDIELPRMRGTELAAQLAAIRAGVKVLFVSGHVPEGPLPAGARALQKPVSTELLLRTVRAQLDGDAPAT